MKIKTRKTLIRLLDKACSERARRLAGKLCDFCVLRGKPANPVTEAFHFLSRGHYSTRWEPENLWASCAFCNIRFEHDADFVSRVVEWYKKKWGTVAWDALVLRYHSAIPIKTWELKEKLEKFNG